MEPQIIPLAADKPFRFRCSPSVPCFNACCRDLNQALAPYDILRLKNHLGLSSGRFLETYTSQHIGPESGLPVITLKPDQKTDRQCPFVTPKGCSVYPDRPASCRLYPLARGTSRDRQTGVIREHFALIQEPHCLGFRQNNAQTARSWIGNQELGFYNEFNDLFLELISLKNRLAPGPLDLVARHLFHRALYDLDAFREQIFHRGLPEGRAIDEAEREKLMRDDAALLRLAHTYVKKALFPDDAQR
jgi:Fe-S-cluster containining protein